MSRLLPLRHTLPRTLRTAPRNPTPTTTTPSRLASSFLQTGPSPPRLPADQQAEFERLQRAAEAALSSHTTIPSTADANANADPNTPLTTSRHVSTPSTTTQATATATATSTSAAGAIGGAGEGEMGPSAGSFSGGMRKGAPPEFVGDKNPATGEVGGPKNEPLRWGGGGDWSFNGRVTDF